MNPLDPFNYRLLVNAASGRPELSVHLANFRTAYQLSLDGNLPGPERAAHGATALRAARSLIDRICSV